MRITFVILLMLAAIQGWGQKTVTRKLSAVSRIAVADSVEVMIHSGKKNSIQVFGQAEALRTFVIKQKGGALTFYQTTRAQVFATEHPVDIAKNMNIDSVVVVLSSKPENIHAANGAVIRFGGVYTPKRLILKLEKNARAYGKISCEAFGLYVQTGAEAYVSGQYRTCKVTADSAAVGLESYQAENSDFSVTGGSILSARGSTAHLKLHVGGLSRLEALQLESRSCSADISGRSDAFFKVTGDLRLKGRDKSHIIVTGTPKAETDVSADCKYGRR